MTTDDLIAESELSGQWFGSYRHRQHIDSDREYPIFADITCRAGRIEGTMIDGETEIVRDFSALYNAAGQAMADHEMDGPLPSVKKARELVLESHLARESRIEGRWLGKRMQVRFVKIYL